MRKRRWRKCDFFHSVQENVRQHELLPLPIELKLLTAMPDVTISEVMEAYAKDAEESALNLGVVLDYSEASLENVDAVLDSITDDGVVTPQSDAEEAELATLSKVYGGYVGQVVIKQVGGEWEMQDLPDGSCRVLLRCYGVEAFPIVTIFKRLTQDQFSRVAGYCRALRKIIELRKSREGNEV